MKEIDYSLLATVTGGADASCGNFVQLQAPNGSPVYYDPVGIMQLSAPVKGESTKNAQTALKTQLGTFYSSESVDAVKNKLATACGAKSDDQ